MKLAAPEPGGADAVPRHSRLRAMRLGMAGQRARLQIILIGAALTALAEGRNGRQNGGSGVRVTVRRLRSATLATAGSRPQWDRVHRGSSGLVGQRSCREGAGISGWAVLDEGRARRGIDVELEDIRAIVVADRVHMAAPG